MKYFAKLIGGETYWTRGIDFVKEVEQEVDKEHYEYLKNRTDVFEVREEKETAKKAPSKKKEETKTEEGE